MSDKKRQTNKTVDSFCNSCSSETHHAILFEHSDGGYIEEIGMWWETIHQVVRCLGCDNVSYRRIYENSDYIDYDDQGNGVMVPRIETYPYSSAQHEGLVLYRLPSRIAQIYKEVVNCLNNKNYLLVSMGCRSIVEAICDDKGIKGNNLEVKINNLFRGHLISKLERDRMHAIRFLGNTSVHELEYEDSDEVNIAFNLVETILDNIYIKEHEFKKLKTVPVRDFKEFLQEVEKGLKKVNDDDEISIRNLISKDKRIISEDLEEFEKELQEMIKDGRFTGLSIIDDKIDDKKSPQKYKVHLDN